MFRQMPYDPTKRKEQNRKHYEKNRDKIKKQYKEYRENNQAEVKEYQDKYRDAKTQNALNSIISKCIIDIQKWNRWCNEIKRHAKDNKHPYSVDLTNDIMFEMMIKGCHYCGDIATTIDRLDSTLDHTIDNCVGCCEPCNTSKGTADPSTFIRKSYYRTRGEYVDEVTDVWFENKTKPRMWGYKRQATKQEVPFEMSKEKWNAMIIDNCEYCHRSPTTWFGIDRVVPSLGYVDGNVVTCCFDCNLDKHEHDVQTMMTRNERIATRVDNGNLNVEDHPRVILHQGTHISRPV